MVVLVCSPRSLLTATWVVLAVNAGHAPPCPFLSGNDVRGKCRASVAFGVKVGWDCSCWKKGVCDDTCLKRCEQAEYISSGDYINKNKIQQAVCNNDEKEHSHDPTYLATLVVTLKEKNQREKQVKEANEAVEAARRAKALEDKQKAERQNYLDAKKRQELKNGLVQQENARIEHSEKANRKKEHQQYLKNFDDMLAARDRNERDAAQAKRNLQAQKKREEIESADSRARLEKIREAQRVADQEREEANAYWDKVQQRIESREAKSKAYLEQLQRDKEEKAQDEERQARVDAERAKNAKGPTEEETRKHNGQLSEMAKSEIEHTAYRLFCEKNNKDRKSFTLSNYKTWISSKSPEAVAWVKEAATLVPPIFCALDMRKKFLNIQHRAPADLKDKVDAWEYDGLHGGKHTLRAKTTLPAGSTRAMAQWLRPQLAEAFAKYGFTVTVQAEKVPDGPGKISLICGS